jgi:hypothetical protein
MVWIWRSQTSLDYDAFSAAGACSPEEILGDHWPAAMPR